MLNDLRARLGPALERMGGAFARTGLSPNAWTCIALACAFVASLAYGLGTAYVVIGGLLLLASGFFDMVDGQVARVTARTSRLGSFLDSVSDKAAEAAVFLGILVGGLADPYLALLAATLSLLVSYTRAKADALGIRLQGIGIGERAERLLVVAVLGMVPGMMHVAVAIVAVMAGITFVQRVVFVARRL